jgi:predicted permease
VRLLVHSGPSAIPRLAEIHVDGSVVAFTILVAAIVAAACSAFPAIRFLRSSPLSGLRDGGRGGTAGGTRQRTRSALVVAQVALALVVLAASGLLLRSFQQLHAVRPGFNVDGVATLWVSTPHSRYPTDTSVVRFYSNLIERVAQLPGVRNVGLSSRIPLGGQQGMNQNPMYVEGDASTATKIPPLEVYVTVDSGYFRTMGIPLVAGRLFDRLDRQHPDEAIISLETAKAFFHDSTGRAALGRRFQELPNAPWHTIIGVVGSVRDTGLAGPPARSAYLPETVGGDTTTGQLQRTMGIVARTGGDVATTTRGIQRVIREMDPTLPTFGVRSMSETVEASMALLSFTMIVLVVAAAVTLVLGMVGLYGVIAYIVSLRSRELGVRIALGAQPRAVAAMVTRQGLVLCGIGVAIGLVMIVVGGRFLRSLLFEVGPTDPLTLGATVGIIAAFALLASWVPARRAARVNPAEALRAD